MLWQHSIRNERGSCQIACGRERLCLASCQSNSELNFWPDLTEIAQYTTQLAAFQKLFDHFKKMTIFNGVTSEDVKKSFQATIQYASTYFSTNIANHTDFCPDPQKSWS